MTRALGVLVLAIAASGLVAAAPRDACARGVHGWVEVGPAQFEHDGATQLGLRLSGLESGRPCADVGVHFLLLPAVFAMGDLDVACPLAIGERTWLVPRAGVSGLFLGGPEFAAALAGVNAGAGLVLDAAPGMSVRLDVGARQFINEGLDDGFLAYSASVGVGW